MLQFGYRQSQISTADSKTDRNGALVGALDFDSDAGRCHRNGLESQIAKNVPVMFFWLSFCDARLLIVMVYEVFFVAGVVLITDL